MATPATAQTTTSIAKAGVRDSKKKDTRRLILKCANALFHERGFAATKLEDIATGAGVHKQTILRYFGSKEEIALAFRQVALEKFTQGLLDPARSMPVLQYWRAFIELSTREVMERGDVLRYAKLVVSEPALVAASLSIFLQYENLLAVALSREDGIDPAIDVYSRMLSAFLVAGNFSIARNILSQGELANYSKTALAVVDFAIHQFPKREVWNRAL